MNSRRGLLVSAGIVSVFWAFALYVHFALRNLPPPRPPPPPPSGSQKKSPPPPTDLPREIAEIVKKDCQWLVEGQLLFEPSRTMRQGQAYPVFARLTRNPGVNITEGLDGTKFVIVKERVSCKVSMILDSAPEEPNAFRIDKVPADRGDDQFLEPDKFSEWDWRVTPRHHGTLHLLLYVAPMLYVDGIGSGLKEFKEQPRVITVTPDYLYESGAFLKDNWVILGGLLTAIVIHLFLWFRTQIIDWFQRRATGKKRLIVSAND